MYDLFETEEFLRSLERLPGSNAVFLRQKLDEYVYPQLREYDPDPWRYRVGRYRIFYVIDEEDRVVLLLAAAQRKHAYR